MTEFPHSDPPSQPPLWRVRAIMGVAIALFLGIALWGIGYAKGQWGGGVTASSPTPTAGVTPKPTTTSAAKPPTSAAPTTTATPTPTVTVTVTKTPTTTKPAVAFPSNARLCASGEIRAAAGTPRTTCSFATAVRNAYAAAGGSGSMSVRAHSVVTDTTYTMRCVAGTYVTCRGANNAIVYLAR